MRRRTWLVVVVGVVASLGGGCAARQTWRLVEPPETADGAAPGGVRLHPHAPVEDWRIAGTYASEDACATACH